MYKESILSEKSLEFAAQTIKFCIQVNKITGENIITKQLIRSSTSIGANISEANYGVSRADFISKMHISMKEASESEYWLKLLHKLKRWDIDVFKFEDLAANSRPLKWKDIVGSTGQTNTTYLMIAICLISYIRKLYNRNSNDTRKVILCDNPFGSSGATYLYEPLMQLLEVNNIQFICPGFNIPASLLGLFKVNYVLDQKLLPNNKLLLVAKTLEGRKQFDNNEYLFSGAQLKLEGM